MTETLSPRDPKIVAHLQRMHAAGNAGGGDAFLAALAEFRNDASLDPAQVGAILKTLAQLQAGAYHFIITGKHFPPPAVGPRETSEPTP